MAAADGAEEAFAVQHFVAQPLGGGHVGGHRRIQCAPRQFCLHLLAARVKNAVFTFSASVYNPANKGDGDGGKSVVGNARLEHRVQLGRLEGRGLQQRVDVSENPRQRFGQGGGTFGGHHALRRAP